MEIIPGKCLCDLASKGWGCDHYYLGPKPQAHDELLVT